MFFWFLSFVVLVVIFGICFCRSLRAPYDFKKGDD